MNAADMVGVPEFMPEYKGEKRFLKDGQVIDLGGRQLEVVFTPGHTPGSTTFVDKENGYGFSGDSFGSGNLLVFTTLRTEVGTCNLMSAYMGKYGINKLFPRPLLRRQRRDKEVRGGHRHAVLGRAHGQAQGRKGRQADARP